MTQPETSRVECGPITKNARFKPLSEEEINDLWEGVFFALGMAALLERQGFTVAAAELRRLHAENEALRRERDAEREACAKVCEGRIGGAVQTNEWWSGFRAAMKSCAAAIRARSNT